MAQVIVKFGRDVKTGAGTQSVQQKTLIWNIKLELCDLELALGSSY